MIRHSNWVTKPPTHSSVQEKKLHNAKTIVNILTPIESLPHLLRGPAPLAVAVTKVELPVVEIEDDVAVALVVDPVESDVVEDVVATVELDDVSVSFASTPRVRLPRKPAE